MSDCPVWLDVDLGHDDALCLFYAIYGLDRTILNISTCFGNASCQNTTLNTAKCLVAFDAATDLKVFPGANKPLYKPYVIGAENIHGSSGLDGVTTLPPASDIAVQARIDRSGAIAGIVAAAQSCQQAGVRFDFVSTGPITNLALFLRSHKELAAATLNEILYMGGVFDEVGNSNKRRTAEWNVYCCPQSLQIVLKLSPCPFRMFPLDLTHQAIFRVDHEFKRIAATSSTLRTTLFQVVDFFRATYASEFGFYDGPPVHDLMTVMYLQHPRLFIGAQYNVSVQLSGPDVGQTKRQLADNGNAWVADKIADLEELWDCFFQALDKFESL